jgi:hypothetical protein
MTSRAKGRRQAKAGLHVVPRTLVGLTIDYTNLDLARPPTDIATYGLPEKHFLHYMAESWSVVRCHECGKIGVRFVVEDSEEELYAETIHGVHISAVDSPSRSGWIKCSWDSDAPHIEAVERRVQS